MPDPPAQPTFFGRFWPLLLALLGLVAALWPWFALPAAFASLVGVVALRRPSEAELPRARLWILAGSALAVLGLGRFLVEDAMPGIVGGGRRAVEQRVVSRLRDLLFAQDAMRRAGWIDPDGDGIGSAAWLEELCGGPPRRGQALRPTPVLHCGELIATALGPAARSGPYLYTSCLPAPGGGWAAAGAPVDEEAAERHFIAFAWPERHGPFERAFFIDEHENIRVALLPAPAQGAATPFAASCAAALEGPEWQVWKGKQPRSDLPGDPTAGGSAPDLP